MIAHVEYGATRYTWCCSKWLISGRDNDQLRQRWYKSPNLPVWDLCHFFLSFFLSLPSSKPSLFCVHQERWSDTCWCLVFFQSRAEIILSRCFWGQIDIPYRAKLCRAKVTNFWQVTTERKTSLLCCIKSYSLSDNII